MAHRERRSVHLECPSFPTNLAATTATARQTDRSTPATAMAPAPPPPPPRATQPATASPADSSTPQGLSRPGTPSSTTGGGVRAPKAQTLALPALLHDLTTLLHASPSGQTALVPADKFAPGPPPEDAYAPRKPDVDRAARGQELLAAVRGGDSGGGADGVTREDAPLLADAWVDAMDRVLSRAEARPRGDEGTVGRAQKVERWAGEVERGLTATA
ncbi:hypothetical protein DMC30DRAFT_213551 [Rhodotorula diobovata]|uniref:Uncharacterized protein n=1 Tax=Rhodotorula diobovata TaxID=5288 RepID=A0A5C5G6M2_9BASI|nr:hypothetical protein DMC30DRAFT_213551 [Rhodotorula diobovata]